MTNLHDNGTTDNMVHCAVVERLLDIQEEVVLIGADGTDEFGKVIGVKGARLGGQTARKVCIANMDHTLMGKEI